MEFEQQWNDKHPFCGSPFWDLNVTWVTDSPNFTPCFQKTFLVWVPCGFLALVVTLQALLRRTPNDAKKIPLTPLHLAKAILCLILIATTIAELCIAVQCHLTGDHVPTVDFISLPMKLATYILVLWVMWWNRRRGQRSVTVLFIFWFLLSLCGVVPYIATLRAAFSQEWFPVTDSRFVLPSVAFPVILCHLILSAFNEVQPPGAAEERSPVQNAPFLSLVAYSWITSLMMKAIKDTLSKEDFSPLPPELGCKQLHDQFSHTWQKQLSKIGITRLYGQSAKVLYKLREDDGGGGGGEAEGLSIEEEKDVKKETPTKRSSIALTIFKTFWPMFLLNSFLELTYDFVHLLPPIVLNLVIDYVASDQPAWRGYLYAFGIFGASFAGNLLMTHYLYFIFDLALRIKVALCTSIYRKSLRLSTSSRRKYTVGELVNLMSVDADKIFDLAIWINMIWGAPIRVTLTIVLLWQYIGPSCLTGVAIIILTIPITGFIARKIRSVQENQMKKKDLRLKHMNEILNGIKVLKLCAWEIPFMDVIRGIRLKEVNLLRSSAYLSAANMFTWSCVPFFIAAGSFITFVFLDENNVLDPSIAFVCLTLFNMLRFSLVVIPFLVSSLVQTQVSLKRLSDFFVCEELDPELIGNKPPKGEAVSVEDGFFSWEQDSEPYLKNINIHIPKGHLVAVVGQVGAGKSSLLSALLGEMYKVTGGANLQGKIAYVPQQAWIQNATLKQNILFSKPYNESQYNKVLDECCLRPDLEVLPGGDLTEIGEKGVNLSGGQKQRVSLARAVFQDTDLYLLDDPLSAVDAHVGKHIFKHVVGPQGMLRRKTRILVTHDISILPEVDFIITMNNGEIQEIGTYQELVNQKGAFADFMDEYQNQNINDEIEDIPPGSGISRQTSVLSEKGVRRRFSSQTSRSISTRSVSTEEDKFIGGKEAQLLEEEAMELGKVKAKVYFEYFRHASYTFAITAILGYVTFNSFEVASNVWLSKWASDRPLPDGSQDTHLRNMRIGIYTLLGAGGGFAVLLGYAMLAKGATRASKFFHIRMLDCVMKTPMAFFDTTPLGRILNRFSKDIEVVDTQMPMQFNEVLYHTLTVLSILVVISMNSAILIAAVIPLAVLYYLFQRVFINASRQIKRLESVTRSPIFSYFSESVQGSTSIRAYRAQKRFVSTSDQLIHENLVYTFNGVVCNRWLNVRLVFLGCLIVLATALLAVLSKEVLDPGVVGLSMSYALNVTDALTWLVLSFANLETRIVSVERIEEYCHLTPEAPWDVPTANPDPAWPETGNVRFAGYSTRYRQGTELVLKGVNLDIKPTEKVGIVGRTGAGKSSLTLALFRIIEAEGGTVIIDGVDVSKIGLHSLRSRMTIIPQDPVLFTGTLRMNLDPNDQHSDEEVWTALEHAHLKDHVTSLPDGLQHSVAEGGENLSVGQRQLVCLARALLKKNRILVLDEATAAVDMETDKLIQNTIREEFSDCTIITIAHRLHTIMDSDRVIVMDQGKVAEQGPPKELLEKPNSLFYGMAKDARLI